MKPAVACASARFAFARSASAAAFRARGHMTVGRASLFTTPAM